jgi:hypothetical protein
MARCFHYAQGQLYDWTCLIIAKCAMFIRKINRSILESIIPYLSDYQLSAACVSQFILSKNRSPTIVQNKKVWEELIACFLLIRHGPHIKRCVQQSFYSCVWIRCRGNVFTEPLPSKDRRDTHIDTHTDGRDLWSTPLRWAQVPWYTYQVL